MGEVDRVYIVRNFRTIQTHINDGMKKITECFITLLAVALTGLHGITENLCSVACLTQGGEKSYQWF